MSVAEIVQRPVARRLGVISNPLSGGNRNKLERVSVLLKERQDIYHAEAQTPAAIAEVLDEFERKEVQILAVNGGDGTVHAVLTALCRRPSGTPLPLIALLRSGTASMIARDVGLSGPAPAALQRLLSWLRTGAQSETSVQRPVLKVTSRSDGESRYGMFFGAAGICQGIRYCLDQLHTRGVRGELAAGLTLARFLLSALGTKRRLLHPVPASVILDGETITRRDYLFLFVSTLERLFLGLRPYWGSENAPLHYTALNSRPRGLLSALPQLMRGRTSSVHVPGRGYISRNIREARISISGGFTIDGELYGHNHQDDDLLIEAGETVTFLQV